MNNSKLVDIVRIFENERKVELGFNFNNNHFMKFVLTNQDIRNNYNQFISDIKDCYINYLRDNLDELVIYLEKDCFSILEEELFDVNIQDSQGNTLLSHVVYDHNYPATKILLEHGSDPNITNFDQVDEVGKWSIINELLNMDDNYIIKNGIDKNIRNLLYLLLDYGAKTDSLYTIPRFTLTQLGKKWLKEYKLHKFIKIHINKCKNIYDNKPSSLKDFTI